MNKVIQLKRLEKDFNYFVDELTSLCKDDLSLINSVILDKLDSDKYIIRIYGYNIIRKITPTFISPR